MPADSHHRLPVPRYKATGTPWSGSREWTLSRKPEGTVLPQGHRPTPRLTHGATLEDQLWGHRLALKNDDSGNNGGPSLSKS